MGRKLANTKQKYPQPINPEGSKVIKLRFNPQPKNESQRFYLESLRDVPLTIGQGPAGCGKTFLAMAIAVEKLLSNEISKIIITRPIVEAGEKLGFLPGTLEEKIHPYLIPLLDSLEDLVGPTKAKQLLDTGKVEFAPLAFMKGRTLNNAYVILDEAQNTTAEQMKMFITRIGEYSQFVINGDTAQSDLKPWDGENGLAWVTRVFRGVNPDIQVVEFGEADSVRSRLVTAILAHIGNPDNKPKEPLPRREKVQTPVLLG